MSITKHGFSIHLKSADPCPPEKKAVDLKKDYVHIIFSVAYIEELYTELTDKLVEIIQPLRQMPYGKEFYIADPDGYKHAYVGVN